MERIQATALLEAIAVPICLKSPDLAIKYANRQFRQAFGDWQGRPCHELVCGYSEPCAECPTARVFQTAKSRRWECAAADGRMYLVHGSLCKDEDGAPLVLETYVSVTRLRHLEQAHGQLERRFLALFENRLVGMIQLDTRGRIVSANDTVYRFLKYSAEELEGLQFIQLTHPDDRGADAERLMALLRGEQSDYLLEKRCVCRDGSVVWCRWYTSLVCDTQGTPELALVVCDGCTGQRATEEELQESSRRQAESEKLVSMGRMAARIAHEINNPLAGIKYSFRLVRDAVPDDHPDRDMVERIDHELDRITAIVRQMYMLSAARGGKAVRVSVAEAVRDVLLMLESLRVERQAEVVVQNMSSELAISLPEGNLHQILYNLVANALEASPAGGQVTVWAASDDVSLTIAIEDEGEGIPPEFRDQVFAPFFTTKADDNTRSGMGMGLSVVKSVVESIGGRVEFESTPGVGTKFRVVLPYTDSLG